MLLIQFNTSVDIQIFPVEILQYLKHNTYLIDANLTDYDTINYITSNYDVLSMESNADVQYTSMYELHTTSYTSVSPENTLAPLIEKLDFLCTK